VVSVVEGEAKEAVGAGVARLPTAQAAEKAAAVREANRPEVRAIRDRTNKQIEGLLNAQQLTTFRQLFEQQRTGGDSVSHHGGGSS